MKVVESNIFCFVQFKNKSIKDAKRDVCVQTYGCEENRNRNEEA